MKFSGYSWLIVVIIGFKISGCGTIGDYYDFELGRSVLPEGRLGLGGAAYNKEFQIVTPVLEQILINPAWIKEIIGWLSSSRAKLIRSNQVVNPIREL